MLDCAQHYPGGRTRIIAMSFIVLLPASLALASAAVYLERRMSFLIGVVPIVGILILHGGLYFGATADDAFISFRYAENLAVGNGPVWNSGERVEGYTNFLWVLLLSLPAALNVSLVVSAQVLGVLASVGVVAAVYGLARVWTAPLPVDRRNLIAMVTAAGLAMSAPFAFWTFAGLETTLFAFLVTGGAFLHLREQQRNPPFYWSGLVFLLATLTRPEGLLFFGLTYVFKAYDVISSRDKEDGTRRLISWLISFSVPLGIYIGWRMLYYGYPLPNTFYAKVPFDVVQLERGLQYLAAFGQTYIGLLLILVPAAIYFSRDRRQPTYLLVLLSGWIGYVLYIGGDGLAGWRLLVPIMPILYFLIVVSIVHLYDTAQRSSAARITFPAIAGIGALAVAGAALLYPSQNATDLAFEETYTSQRIVIGRWLNEHVSQDYTIAVFAAGAIPYYSELRAIDMFGLNDEHIAHEGIDNFGSGIAGHEKFDSQYVFDRRPELIFPHVSLHAGPVDQEYYEGLSPSALGHGRATAVLTQIPSFWHLYDAVAVELAPFQWLNLLVRQDADIPGVHEGVR